MNLLNRAAIITGASQGLGAAIAERFVREGASVVLCARSGGMLKQVQQYLASLLVSGQSVHIMEADVSDKEDIDHLLAEALDRLPHLDILVNNAGVYGPMGALESVDWEEWVDALNINVLGTVYPCRAILPHMKQKKYGKIINLSGGGATNPLPRLSAYAASKAAVVRFTETLAIEVKESGIDVNAVAPGLLATRLNDNLIAAGPEVVGKEFHERIRSTLEKGSTPLEVGASLVAWLASAESDGITGRLISAPWDAWEKLPAHRDELDGSDIYTLRRIVPKDRGKDWGEK